MLSVRRFKCGVISSPKCAAKIFNASKTIYAKYFELRDNNPNPLTPHGSGVGEMKRKKTFEFLRFLMM